MRYAYKDLGRQREGCTAIVRWGGSPATVMLLDPVNFTKYLDRLPCNCDAGGRYLCPPARLPIPEDGRWYAVVDLGGHTSATPPTVEVQGQAHPRDEHQREEQARVDANGNDAGASRRGLRSRSRSRRGPSRARRPAESRPRRRSTSVR